MMSKAYPKNGPRNIPKYTTAAKGAAGGALYPGTTYIGGRNAVRQLIEQAPKRIKKIFISDRSDQMDQTGRELLTLVTEKRLRIEELPIHLLVKKSRHHQGFVAEIEENRPLDLKGLEEIAAYVNQGIIIALDGVQDPQNVGSILRAADSFGALAVLWSKNRSAPLTEAVHTVSAGASQFVPLVIVSNLREALLRLKKLGFFSVATIIDENKSDFYSFEFPEKSVLILGGEADGVQPLIAKEADTTVYIEQHGVVDSLNVGQAAAVFLSGYRRQFSKGADSE